MKLEALALNGVLRFEDAVTLDLTDLPSGLIAIVGPNGEGKTTILEAGLATLFRQFPSRAERQLFDYAHGRDGYLEATFAVEGRGVYRARVNVDAVKRVSDAALEQIQPDGSRRILNDGKVSTYDEVVRSTFPPAELLLASAFAAQNRAGSFITLDRKGRRQLFSALLGLDHYEAMAQTARTAAGMAEKARDRLHDRRQLLERDCTPAIGDELEQRRLTLQADLETTTTRLQTYATSIGVAETTLADVEEAAAAHREVLAAIDQRDRAIERLKVQRETARQAVDALPSEQARHDRTLATAAGDALRDIDERLQNNRAIIDRGETIRHAVAELAAAEAGRDRVQAEERTLLGVDSTRLDAVQQLGEDLAKCDQAARELEAIQQAAETFGRVPCRATGKYAACEFLKNATTATARIPALVAMTARHPTLAATRTQALEDLNQNRARLADVRQRMKALAVVIKALRDTAGEAPLLAAADARVSELTDRRRAVEARLEADRSTAAHEARSRTLALTKEIHECEEALLTEQDARATLEAQLPALKAAAEQRIAHIARLTELRTQKDEVAAWRVKLQVDLEVLEDRRQGFLHRQAELAALTHAADQVEDEWLEWQLLTKAFGREGLPVLEIDAAGPTVSSYCNDLLSSCFGPRFTVDLVTQQAKASKGRAGGVKEVFELKVWDNERGGDPRDVADLSGGEKTIVDEALKNAIAILVNTRNPIPVRTCWRDETTGALDAENAGRYVAMLRRVQEIAGFHHVLFVTHNPDAAAAADAQLHAHDGRVDVLLPPYREAA